MPLRSHGATVSHLRNALPRHSAPQQTLQGHRPAAVAVLLVERAGRTYLPFTLRSETLPSHRGQISFPGGKVDADDTSLANTAIRETHEELGLSPAAIDVLGELADVLTPTGYIIRPVVAELETSAADYRPNPSEVANVFEVSLAELADPSVREDLGEREYYGERHRVHAYNVGAHHIWGATALMIERLLAQINPRA